MSHEVTCNLCGGVLHSEHCGNRPEAWPPDCHYCGGQLEHHKPSCPLFRSDLFPKTFNRLAVAIDRLADAVNNKQNQLDIMFQLDQMEKNIMSAIGDWSAKNGPKLDRIQTGLDAVQALVEKLQNSPGGITPEDQALLDQIEAKIDAIATDADSVPAPPTA